MTPAGRLPLALALALATWVGSSRADEALPSGALRRFGDSRLRLTDIRPPALSPDGN